MGSLKVQLKPAVEKDLRKIPQKILSRILEAIEGLGQDPFPPQTLKLIDADRLYRLRVGEYRVIYEVETQLGAVIVHHVRHRGEAYRSL